MATLTVSPVVLTTPKDWHEWIEIVRTVAIGLGVWEFMNPNTLKAQLPTLAQPIRPLPEHVRTSTRSTPTTFSILSDDEKEEYRNLQEDYRRDLRLFDKRTEGLGKMRAEIQRSVARQHLSYTFDCDSAYDMIVKLQKRFSPTTEARERELIARYTHFRTEDPKEEGLDGWVAGFEQAYSDCLKADLPDVQGNRPTRDFLVQASAFEPGFSDYWQNKLMDTEEGVDFLLITQKFRDYRSENVTRKKPRGRHGAFATTLQGQERTSAETKVCLCNEEHLFKDCPYLNPSIRDKAWIPEPRIEKAVESKLRTNKRLREIVSRVTGHSQEDDEPPSSF